MRIRNIRINQWRHFSNIGLTLDDDARLVCIVGANGTGKSHILELIAACAHRLGISPGIEIPRGDPFSDPHDFSLTFFLAEGVSEAIDPGLHGHPSFPEWDRTLTITSSSIPPGIVERIEAGGIAQADQRGYFAYEVVGVLQRSKSVHFLSLDADRAYPKKAIQHHEIAQAYEIDWAETEYTRGRSFRTTTILYDEWTKYFLAQENQSGTTLIRDIRRARQTSAAEPTFTDHFRAYKEALQQILPHVVFVGIDSKKRHLLFDTTGLELSFNQLSGGEREIAFLIGQIDRFGLRHGLFLLDEPELHLNADLIRSWVAYLSGTIQTGQVWLATHSLEAVEAAGQQSTFVLERNETTRKVDGLDRLDSRPVLSALSRAVGTPAFSLSALVFVFVEGEEGVGERELFRQLAGLRPDVRFIECGSCTEVARRVKAVRSLANEAEAGIRIGGVVDRDFLLDAEATALARDTSVFVLPVHEVENLFLQPSTIDLLLRQHGRDVDAGGLVRSAGDARAGSWVFQHAMATRIGKSLPGISMLAKERLKGMTWMSMSADLGRAVESVVAVAGYGDADKQRLFVILESSIGVYARKRDQDDLWRVCEGKQVLNEVARAAGFSSASALMQAALAAWTRDEERIPNELAQFRQYLAGL